MCFLFLCWLAWSGFARLLFSLVLSSTFCGATVSLIPCSLGSMIMTSSLSVSPRSSSVLSLVLLPWSSNTFLASFGFLLVYLFLLFHAFEEPVILLDNSGITCFSHFILVPFSTFFVVFYAFASRQSSVYGYATSTPWR